MSALVPASPAEPVCATSSLSARALPRAAGSSEVATRSMSLQVSAQRRAEPAITTWPHDGCARIAAASSSATGRTFESRRRSLSSPASGSVSSAARTFSSTLAPSPLTSRIRSCSAASRSPSRSLTPSSSYRRRAVLAPRPGTRVTSTSEAGNFALSLSAEGIEPVSIRVSTFWAIVLPNPGSSVSLPSLASCSSETGLSVAVRAASL